MTSCNITAERTTDAPAYCTFVIILCKNYTDPVVRTEAPSTPATMSKRHCRMLQVERFFRHSQMLFASTKSNVALTLLSFLSTMSNAISFFFRQSRNKWNMFSFFDFVERTKFHEKLVRRCCQKRQQRRSNVVECYNSNDSFDKVECCFDVVAGVDWAWGAAIRRPDGHCTGARVSANGRTTAHYVDDCSVNCKACPGLVNYRRTCLPRQAGDLSARSLITPSEHNLRS